MAYISDFEWNDDNTVTVPKIAHKPKKITGSRIAAVLDKDPFASPFAVWCELTRTASKPYVKTPHTVAGNILEPHIIDFVRSKSKMSIVSPADIWGRDFKNQTNYDFYPENSVFGGMWDARLQDASGKTVGVLEIKTSSNPSAWKDEPPEYYDLQGQLYAYLMGVPYYHFGVSFLDDAGLKEPTKFICTDENTSIYHAKVSEFFPEQYAYALDWYKKYIHDGAVSPAYDEGRDWEYLEILSSRKPRQ